MRGANGLYIVRKLGLTPSLKLCLDAGDGASYTSGQSWLDLSGGGYDFFLGADGAATGTDPTFNGTPGNLSSAEYFSSDGGDRFTYNAANETWINNIHKDNAKFTMLCWFFPTGGTWNGIMGTNTNNNTVVGFNCFCHTTSFWLNISNGGGVSIFGPSTGGAADGVWNFYAVSVDEANNTSAIQANSTQVISGGQYASPSASDAGVTMNLMTCGAGGLPAQSGARMAMVCMWEGLSLTPGEMMAFFNATRGRFEK